MLDTAQKILINATREYAIEVRSLSWWHTISTLLLVMCAISMTFLLPAWPFGVITSVIAGLLLVRCFILYHDFMHGAILRKSEWANPVFSLLGLYILTPKRVWKETHNYHHAHTAKIATSHIGSFKMVTTHMWKRMNCWQRLNYRFIRHPFNFIFALFTVFAVGMCLSSFRRDMRKHWDSLLALVLHIIIAVTVIRIAGADKYFLGILLPLMLAATIGAYLFYAQHNFPDTHVKPMNEWNYVYAAMHSSSYMKMGPLLRWITGNIGYHHVHHLNAQIPFYRLPEAMAAIPELQKPPATSLKPRDIYRCLQLKLWDPEKGQMVGYLHNRQL